MEEVSNAEEELSKQFREYSVAEFFKRNRQMLGYTGKIRSLTTIVHEAVTNSLDSAEDARILPDISVEIKELPDGHFKLVMEDNGTGVPKKDVGKAFGKLLAGTKFHVLRQKRGQQGLGISYAVLFSQLTTGKPAHIKTGMDHKVFECNISIDVKSNEPVITDEKEYSEKFKGVKIELEVSEVGYNRSEYGVYEYLRRTAIANPHAQITLVEPNGEIILFPRASTTLPKISEKVLPHPLGLTTSDLIEMSHSSTARKLGSFFQNEFSRFSADKVKEISDLNKEIDFNKTPHSLTWGEAEAIVKTIEKVKWIAPETSVLIPIGENQLIKALKNILKPEEMKVVERKPKVYRGGIPFMVEAAIAYGGESGGSAGGTKKLEILRYANSTPLLFDSGSCAISEAVKGIDWARYDLNKIEEMPITVFVNFVSVFVPFTGTSKLAVSPEEEIISEIKLALMECARSIGIYLHTLEHAHDEEERRSIFMRYIGEVAICLNDLTGIDIEKTKKKLEVIAKERTAIAEEGDKIEDLEEDEEENEKE
jgi:DNA topoisomerase-6 subunit B